MADTTHNVLHLRANRRSLIATAVGVAAAAPLTGVFANVVAPSL